MGVSSIRRCSRATRLAAVAAVALLLILCHAAIAAAQAATGSPTATGRTNHWGVVVGGSRYLFNYRHSSNALTFYHLLRQHGVDDDHILLFLSDAFACDPRNPFPATVYSTGAGSTSEETMTIRNDPQRRRQDNLYGCSTQVDYAGDDVDVRRFLNVLQGRYDANTPPTRRLISDENSNILIYIAGHAARGSFKFQDSEFLSSADVGETLMMMHAQGRYNKVLFLADTCKGLAMCEEIKAPNVVCLASSDANKDSYSSNRDYSLGMQLTSRWTYEILKLLEGTDCTDRAKGAYTPESGLNKGVSILHHSIYDFNYSPEKARLKGARSVPAHRGAVNDPQAIHTWTVADFLCSSPTTTSPVEVRYDLL